MKYQISYAKDKGEAMMLNFPKIIKDINDSIPTRN